MKVLSLEYIGEKHKSRDGVPDKGLFFINFNSYVVLGVILQLSHAVGFEGVGLRSHFCHLDVAGGLTCYLQEGVLLLAHVKICKSLTWVHLFVYGGTS